MNATKTRARISGRLRAWFDRPLYPERIGVGILPWVAGPTMHTRLFLNPMREPRLNSSETSVDIVRFDGDGRTVERGQHTLGRGGITIIDLPKEDRLTCGYCWVRQDFEYERTVALQFHFQVMGEESFAKTHGRAKGIPVFGKPDIIDSVLFQLTPFPYAASSAISAQRNVRQGFLFLNLSDRSCRICRSGASLTPIIELPPHGSHLWYGTLGEVQAVEFVGSAPFTFYVAMSRPDSDNITLQHIKDTF